MVHKCPRPPHAHVSFKLCPSEGNFQSGVDVMDVCPSGVIILREITHWVVAIRMDADPFFTHDTAFYCLPPTCYWGAHRNNGVHLRCSSIARPFFLVLINFPTHEMVLGILEGLKIARHFHLVFDIKFSNICSQRVAPSRSPFLWILSSLERPSLFMLDHKSVCPPLLSRRVRVMSNHLGPSHLITSRLYTQVKMVPLISHLSGI